jgi:hypothetical protein
VIVAGELPREPHEAPLHLFSARADLVRFGGKSYRRRSERSSALLKQLFEGLRQEGVGMPYTMEDFTRQFVKDHFAQLTAEERRELLESLPPEEQEKMLQALPPAQQEKMLQALPPAQQEKWLQALPPAQRLAGLSAKQIRDYLKHLTAEGRPAPRKPRRKK